MNDEQEVLNFLNGKNNNNVNYGAIDEEAGQISEVHIGRRSWCLIKFKLRESLAEFLGTFIMVIFGIGSIAQTVLSKGENGNWVTISFGFGLGLALALAISRNISGGHLNPAVTITLAVYRKFPWRRVPGYIFAQTTGAFVAAAVVYLNYHSALTNFDGGQRIVSGANSTAGIFVTYPAPFKGIPSSFFSEAFGTFLLLLVFLSVNDNQRNHPNQPIYKIVAPFIIGLALFAIAISFGYETGFALNGARDFGPRLFTLCIGYGVEVFTASNYYFWVPLVAPVIGGLSAGFIYDSLIYWGRSPLNRDRSIRIRCDN